MIDIIGNVYKHACQAIYKKIATYSLDRRIGTWQDYTIICILYYLHAMYNVYKEFLESSYKISTSLWFNKPVKKTVLN